MTTPAIDIFSTPSSSNRYGFAVCYQWERLLLAVVHLHDTAVVQKVLQLGGNLTISAASWIQWKISHIFGMNVQGIHCCMIHNTVVQGTHNSSRKTCVISSFSVYQNCICL